MIKKLRIQNYKCLRDVTLELGPFNVLIGPNDSGKSSIIDVCQRIGRIASRNVFGENHVIENLLWHKDASQKIIWDIEGEFEDQKYCYHVEFAAPISRMPTTEHLWMEHVGVFDLERQDPVVLNQIEDLSTSSGIYQFQPEQIALSSKLENRLALSRTGDNLASTLDYMQNSEYRYAFENIQNDLHKAIPTLNGIVLPTVESNKKRIDFILTTNNGKKPVSIPGNLASSGACLLTAYLTLAHINQNSRLLIEEPENGLHPSRLGMVIEILRQISTGEVGNQPRQIIMTTHSPLVLNFVQPNEVHVLNRDLETGTKVRPMSDYPNIEKLIDEFSVGELWYLLGEEKLVEGKGQ